MLVWNRQKSWQSTLMVERPFLEQRTTHGTSTRSCFTNSWVGRSLSTQHALCSQFYHGKRCSDLRVSSYKSCFFTHPFLSKQRPNSVTVLHSPLVRLAGCLVPNPRLRPPSVQPLHPLCEAPCLRQRLVASHNSLPACSTAPRDLEHSRPLHYPV
jgi:hypothetical protein